MESYEPGNSVDGIETASKESKDIIDSVVAQIKQGVAFDDMKELEGFDNPSDAFVQLDKAYASAKQALLDAEAKKVEDKAKEVSNKEANMAAQKYMTEDKEESPSKSHMTYQSQGKSLWTMKDVVMSLEDSNGFGEYMRQAERGGSKVHLEASIPSEVVRQAVMYSFPLDPSVRVSDEVRRPRPFLDLVNIMVNPRSHIVFAPVVTTVSEQTDAANRPGGRVRAGAANDVDFALGRVELAKESIGAYTAVDKEFGIASPEGIRVAIQSLSYAMLEAISTAALNGDGSGTNWTGILAGLTGASRATAVPGTNAAGSMYSYVEAAIGTLEDRGYVPNAVLSRRNDRNKVRKTLKDENFNAGELVSGQPQPEGVPMIITPDVGNNTVLTGQFSPNNVEIEIQSDMIVTTSDDLLMRNNQTAVSMFVDGNVALYEPRAFFKTTATNNTREG